MRFFIFFCSFIFLTSCNSFILGGQGFLIDDVPSSEYPHWNAKINSNIELNLVNLNTISLQVLDSMPKISAAKIPVDLRNISFKSKIDNSYPDYQIGPGDEVKIDFPSDKNVNQITSKGLKVDAYGDIDFPYLGNFKIGGFNADEAEDLLKTALNNLYVEPKVILSIKKFKSNKAFISGLNNQNATNVSTSSGIQTSVITLDDVPMTVIEALNKANISFSETVPNPFLILKRDDNNHIVDLGFISNNANPNIYVRNNDFLYIPQTDNQKVYMTGSVNSDSIIEFPVTMTLSEALLEGKINKLNANLEEIYVLRVNQTLNDKFYGTAYKLNYKSPTSLVTADNFYLLNKDIVFVSSKKIVRWNQAISNLLSTLDFVNLWKSYMPINSEVLRTQ
tara:strand:- start:864 stop:2039 length:1176 start_codon:yes stop_codon:yes gene_type:complete